MLSKQIEHFEYRDSESKSILAGRSDALRITFLSRDDKLAQKSLVSHLTRFIGFHPVTNAGILPKHST